MKRARGSALAPASFEALARVRRTLREQAVSPAVAQPSPEKPRPAENGAALFRRAVSSAVPLHLPNRVEHTQPRPKPIARQRLRDQRLVLVDALADPWDFDATAAT